MGSKEMEEMAHPTIVKQAEPIREFKIYNSMPPNETNVPVLDYKLYRVKVDKYMAEYKEKTPKKIVLV